MLLLQAPKFQHITSILKSLHWLKVSERIEDKIIPLTYRILNTTQSPYLWPHIYSVSPWPQHTLSSYVTDQTTIIAHSLIDPSEMLHLIFETSFLDHSEFIMQIIYPPLSDLHLNMLV